MNAGPYGREPVCAQTKPTLSPSAVLLPVLCQSYCPNSVQHAFLGIDMSGPYVFLSLFFHLVLVYHPILAYNTSGLIFVPRYLPLLHFFLSQSFCLYSLYKKEPETRERKREKGHSRVSDITSQGLYHMLTFNTGTLLQINKYSSFLFFKDNKRSRN